MPNSQEIETKFRRIAISRINQKKLGDKKYENDAGYWEGGQCNWGAHHNLQEDCQKLAQFFTSITELRNARKELLNFTNQQEFETNKQNLLTKTVNAIDGLKMKTSDNASVGGVCIIWNDFAKHFNSIIDNFRNELERLKISIENVPYNEWKELQKLNSDERKIQKEIEENERKARNETDPDKKKKFLFFSNEAKDKLKKLLARKKELKSANLGDDFNPEQHIDNFLQELENKLVGRSQRPTRPNNNQPINQPSSQNSTDNPANNNFFSNFNNNEEEKETFLQAHWKKILLLVVYLAGVYYIYHQKDHE